VAVLQFIYLNQSVISGEKSINAYAYVASGIFLIGFNCCVQVLFNLVRISGLLLAVYGDFVPESKGEYLCVEL